MKKVSSTAPLGQTLNRRFQLGSWVRALMLCTFAFGSTEAHGQAIAEVVRSTAQIPRDHYKTWSLFLVCNPEWLAPAKSKDLYALYAQFQSFGRTIGDDHVAVWFWKAEKRVDDPNLAANVDVERSVRICQALKLKPSSSPHILVMASYPDESKLPTDFAVFELSKMTAPDIFSLLSKLTDQLVLQGRVGGDPGADPPDRLWIRLLGAAQRLIGNFGCAWSFKVQTGILSADLHSCQKPE